MKQRLLQSLLLLCGLIVGSVAWADEAWEEVSLSNLTTSDIFVIVGTSGSESLAMTNDNGTSSAPAASSVTIADGKITSTVADNIKWNISGNATDGYTFYPNGVTDKWLYCNNTNNGIRVGTNNAKTFKLDESSGYLVHIGTSRYIGIYNNNDWRCYGNTTTNIKGQTFKFYKSVAGSTPNCETPTFSPAGGVYSAALRVEISTKTDGATIYYTTDGSTPTTNSNVYSGLFPITETTTVKAIAVKSGYDNSSVATATYSFILHAGTAEDPYTVADALSAVDAGVGITGVYATGIVSKIVTAFNASYGNITYNISADGKVDSDQLQAFRGKSKDGAKFTSEDDVKVGDIVVVYGNLTKYNSTYEFEADNQLYSLERPVVTSPTLTVSKTSLTGFTYAEGCGPSVAQTFDLAGENLTGNVTLTLDNENFEISVSETNDYATSLTRPKSEFGSKTIYVRLKAGLDVNETYSGTITISSDGAEDKTVTLGGNVTVYVPDYATLPFAFNDGKAKIESTVGLTQSGLGSDYNSTNAPTTQLKFDTTGDYMILKLNEAAGTLAFDIKGNSFSNSTFTVQTSSDGLSYRNLMVYTELEGTQTVALALAPDVRFIKWIYTEKASGNVGLGNIKVVDWAEIVSVNEARYATYVPKHDVIFPDGVEAYIGTINKKYVSLTAVKSAPKDTPVILKNTGRYTLIPVTEETLDDVTGNDLSASDKDVEATGSQYILAKPDGEEVGFYKATGTIPAGKAYLVSNETGHLVKAFYFVGEGETAIGSIQNSNFEIQNGEVYNLAGQKLSKMQKGVNIINGYKVLR